MTAAWLVGMTNAFNLIDGIDGLAAGIAAIAGAACGAILSCAAMRRKRCCWRRLSARRSDSCVFNFAPASIFLGDSGSLVAGFLLAATAITGWQKGATALATGVPLMIFALPIADSALALIRRSGGAPVGRRSIGATLRQIAQPDREHIHHRMLALGWSVRRTVLILYAITAILSAARARHGRRQHAMKRVLLVQPSMQPPGGGNGVAAWMLQALVRRASRHGAVVAAGRDRSDQSLLRHAPAIAATSTRSWCRDRGACSPITCRRRRR